MATPPDFSVGGILTAAQMDQIGLWRVGKNTATSGTTCQVTGCFTTDYANYLVLVDNAVTAATAGIYLTLLVGTTNNAANWVWGSIRADWTAGTYTYLKGSADPNGPQIAVASSTNPAAARVDVFRPNLATWSNIVGQGTDARGTSGYLPINAGGTLQNNTQYDGIQIAVSGSTFTSVSVTVYGYNSL